MNMRFSTAGIGWLGVLLLFIGGASLFHHEQMKPGLHREWEGLYIDLNYRDLGSSLNACLQAAGEEPVFQPDVLLRANKWFSGWSCDQVGNPQKIYSLNYEPQLNHVYYCVNDEGSVIKGQTIPSNVHLSNIEFLTTWDDPDHKKAICGYVNRIIDDVANGKRVLFHCEAGRDRTGAAASLLAAAMAEEQGIKAVQLIPAIECDYRKSKSLRAHKYGRMHRFIDAIGQWGSVSRFLAQTCSLDQRQLRLASQYFIRHQQKVAR